MLGELMGFAETSFLNGKRKMTEKQLMTEKQAIGYLYRELRGSRRGADLDDAVGDAILFAWKDITQNGTDIPLALWRAVRRVRRGQSPLWEPANRERWEQDCKPGYAYPLSAEDFAGRPGLICAQEYREALATDDAKLIDQLRFGVDCNL